MLNNILVRQLCGGNGWRITDEKKTTKGIEVYLEPTRKTAVCSGCGKTKGRIHDRKHGARKWRHLDAWGIQTLIVAPLRRVQCGFCKVRTEQVPWARLGSRFTHLFEREMLLRARDTSISGVCRQLGVHWTTVQRIRPVETISPGCGA